TAPSTRSGKVARPAWTPPPCAASATPATRRTPSTSWSAPRAATSGAMASCRRARPGFAAQGTRKHPAPPGRAKPGGLAGFLLLDPGHQRAEALAALLHLGAGCLLPHALEVLLTRLVLGDPLLGELSRLNVGEDLLHRLAGLVGDHLATAGHVAVLGGVGDRVAHPLDAVLVHEVDDQLQLVQALEVRETRVLARLDQRLAPGAHQ